MSKFEFSLFQTLTSQISVKLITIIAVQATEIPWGIEHPENIFYEYELSQKATYCHHPAGPTPHYLLEARDKVQPGLMTADTWGNVWVGWEVDKDEYEEDGCRDGIAEHVHLNVTLNQ